MHVGEKNWCGNDGSTLITHLISLGFEWGVSNCTDSDWGQDRWVWRGWHSFYGTWWEPEKLVTNMTKIKKMEKLPSVVVAQAPKSLKIPWENPSHKFKKRKQKHFLGRKVLGTDMNLGMSHWAPRGGGEGKLTSLCRNGMTEEIRLPSMLYLINVGLWNAMGSL